MSTAPAPVAGPVAVRAKRAPAAAKVAKPAAPVAPAPVSPLADASVPTSGLPGEGTASAIEAGSPASEPATAFSAGMILSVRTASQKGRWRSGRQFGPEAVELDSAELSPRELDNLLADPQLIVIDIATGVKPD